MSRKKKTTKRKKELTSREKLEQLIKQGKILSTPIYEGETQVTPEERMLASRQVPNGFALVGVSQGLTFSEEDNRASNWHRFDTWIAVNCLPENISEVQDVLEDLVVDKLADKYESIMNFED